MASQRLPGSYLSPPPPRALAHRGFAIDVPENTLLAFVRALALGATHIETDVRCSRDGVAIISHDADLRRLTGRDTSIADLTRAELEKVDLGEGQSVPTLAAALDAFPDARFNIDMKTDDVVAPTIEAVRSAGATGRVLLTSFSERRRRAAKRALPDVATSASAPLFAAALVAAHVGIQPLVSRLLRSVVAVQIPERWGLVRAVSPALVRRFGAAGVEVHVWTIDDPIEMARLYEVGVHGIVTDRIDLALALLAERSTGPTSER